MSTTIDQSFVRQYEREVHEAYQRMGSKLRGTVRTKNNVVGKSTTFQKVGKGIASTKTRHGLVSPMNLSHTPVECTLADFYAGDWVDKLDELKVEHNEREVVVNAGAFALGRKTDEMIIAALDSATTYQTSVNLSAIAVGTFTGLVTTLGGRDVPVDDGHCYGFVSWPAWDKMLQIQQFASQDYVPQAELPFQGKGLFAKRWMGVLWMPHSGLTKSGSSRTCFVYHRHAVGHAIGADVKTDVTWHGDRAAHFVNNMMSQGASLIDAEGVQQLIVNEAA